MDRQKGPLLVRDNYLVTTEAGTIEGMADKGCAVYRGVPYAQPPVGNLRFRSPVAPEPWDGVRPAQAYGPASCQMNSRNRDRVLQHLEDLNRGLPPVLAFPAYTTTYVMDEECSEDCLYLNVWVPEGAEGEALPVFVYYHGGANFVSSGNFDMEDGATMAREQRVIVVRPTYRLGALGWVHFGLLDDRLGEAVNVGVQDQLHALRWVYRNIAAFGGDPEKITIGGESCGATGVSHLMMIPEAQRYARRAVIQSLSPFNVWCSQERPDAVTVAQIYLEILGLTDAQELMTIDPEKLLAVHLLMLRFWPLDRNQTWRPLGSVATGEFQRKIPAQALAQDAYPRQDFELLIGFAKDEWQFYRGHTETMQNGTRDQVLAVIEQVFGTEAVPLYERFQQMHPDEKPGQTLNRIMSMEFFQFSSLLIAQNLSAQGIPVYAFQFSYDLPGAGGYLRAHHTGDIPFIFRNLDEDLLGRFETYDGVDRTELDRLSRQFADMYGSFIRTGNPGEAWPAFDAASQTVLWLGKEIEPRANLMTREVQAFADAGVDSVSELEARMVRNVRAAINTPARAFVPSAAG